MFMDRVILHCDMNSFFASVELLERPDLSGLPVAVSGNPDNRHGVILAKNEEAKKYGIKTAETLWQARKKCPGLVTIPPHHDKYAVFSRKINEIYQRYTDMVEPFSIDESWLDVTGSTSLFGDGKMIADDIRNTVKAELGLTLSAGVSFNKIFAKMGSEYKKPDATTVISRENYKEILWPLPVSEMFFCGAKTAEKLNRSGVHTIGDLALSDRVWLRSLLGKHGETLYIYSNGLDTSPVSLYSDSHEVQSIGKGNTFRYSLTDIEDFRSECMALSDAVAMRLRKKGRKASGVKLDIKDDDLHTISRQKQLPSPTNLATDIFRCAMSILSSEWPEGKPVRMLTVTAIGLTSENENIQLSLFDTINGRQEKNENLEKALDSIRGKYGMDSITFGKKNK